MKKSIIINFLRKLRLLYFEDWLGYCIQKIKNYKQNSQFKKKNRSVVLPPDYLIYESFQMNYKKYYTDSFKTAKWLTNHFSNHI